VKKTLISLLNVVLFVVLFSGCNTGKPSKSTIESSTVEGKSYTIEQIQKALQTQFLCLNGENHQVVFVQEVPRDRDSIFLGPPYGRTIDLSKSSRYRVDVKFEQTLEDYHSLEDAYKEEPNAIRREGDCTITIDYYYFNDVNGDPELAYVTD